MITEIIPSSNRRALERSVEVLNEGGLVAFPTDTVYGLGALAFNKAAIERLYQAKGRCSELPLPILLSGQEQLDLVAVNLSLVVRELADHFWPGPLTIVVQRHPDLPVDLSGIRTVGVRVPDHEFDLELFAATGPLAVTSANLSGNRSPTTAGEVMEDLGGKIELLIDGGATLVQRPSTIVDCTGSAPVLLREGPIAIEQILSTHKGLHKHPGESVASSSRR
jgi:L-threonylcarbamoyladenylate synthase